MTAVRSALILVASFALGGCGSLASFKAGLAPNGTALEKYPQVQQSITYQGSARGSASAASSSAPATGTVTAALPSAAVPQDIDFDLHERFLRLRQIALSSDGAVDAQRYFEGGGDLIRTLCSRWFAGMESEERRLDSVDKSFDVWKAFGTTLMGIAKANASAVALYGGATTVESGLSTAYRDVYLLGGSITKVKQKIFQLLDDYQHNAQPTITNYGVAYSSLERMGALCSPAATKVIIDAGLDTAVVSVNPSGGITAVGSPIAAAVLKVTAAQGKLDTAKKERDDLAQKIAVNVQSMANSTATVATLEAANVAANAQLADPLKAEAAKATIAKNTPEIEKEKQRQADLKAELDNLNKAKASAEAKVAAAEEEVRSRMSEVQKLTSG